MKNIQKFAIVAGGASGFISQGDIGIGVIAFLATMGLNIGTACYQQFVEGYAKESARTMKGATLNGLLAVLAFGTGTFAHDLVTERFPDTIQPLDNLKSRLTL